MHPALHRAFVFLFQHGLAVLFGWVLVEQLGVPVPAMPLLLAAGGFAGTGQLSFFAALVWTVRGGVAWESFGFKPGATQGSKDS